MVPKIVKRREVRSVQDDVVFHVYKDVVHARLTRKETRKRNVVTHHLLSPATFRENKDRKQFYWLTTDGFQIVTNRYMMHYRTGFRSDFTHSEQRYLKPSQWGDVLLSGNLESVVRDHGSIDGFFYDVKGRPVLRGFFFHPLRHDFSEDTYKNLGDLKEHLEEIEHVFGVEISFDHHMNSGRVLQFTYYPTIQYFRSLVRPIKKAAKAAERHASGRPGMRWRALQSLSIFDIERRILKRLQVDKFKKPMRDPAYV